eukprot:scaffold5908_cov142-Isochrysis_galbana.AAC.1
MECWASLGRAKGAASNRCVSHVGRQTRVAQATAPCRRRDDFGVRTDCRCIGWVQWEGVNCDLLYFPQKNASFRASAAAPRPAE